MRINKNENFYPVRNQFLTGADGANKFIILIFILFFAFLIQAPSVLAESNFITGLRATGVTGAGYPDPGAGKYMSFLANLVGSALTPMFFGVTGMLSLIYGGY